MGKRRISRARMFFGFLAFAFTMGGCAAAEEHPKDNVLYQDEIKDSDDYIVVGFSQVGAESDWRNASTESFRSAFTEENGYFLLYEDAQQKQENQLKAVRKFILQEVDYIVLDPIVETGWDAVLQEAKSAGIPVILVDRSVKIEEELYTCLEGSDSAEVEEGLYTCWVGSNFEQQGRRAGEWLVDYLESQGRGEEKIQIVTLQGTPNSTAQIGRTAGFASVLETQNNWEMLESRSGDFTQAKGQEVMEEFLETYENIDVVISENDNMTFGAVDAIHEAGKTCGPDGEIIILSFDCVKAAMESMMKGEINADFECNPILGPRVKQIIEQLEKGEFVEKIQYVEEQYFDASMDLDMIMKTRMY